MFSQKFIKVYNQVRLVLGREQEADGIEPKTFHVTMEQFFVLFQHAINELDHLEEGDFEIFA